MEIFALKGYKVKVTKKTKKKQKAEVKLNGGQDIALSVEQKGIEANHL